MELKQSNAEAQVRPEKSPEDALFSGLLAVLQAAQKSFRKYVDTRLITVYSDATETVKQ
jgi:hypothetical protein